MVFNKFEINANSEELILWKAITAQDTRRVMDLLTRKIHCYGKDFFLDIIEYGNSKIIEAFLECGYNVNVASTTDGNTPLHVACKNVDVSIVTLLLEHGANFSARNQEGTTPMEILATHYFSTARSGTRLANNRFYVMPKEQKELHERILKISQKFFQHGFKLDATDFMHRWIVELMLLVGTKKLAKLLATHGYDFTYRDNISNYPTMLHSVAQHGNFAVTSELLHHIDINSPSNCGTPLHVASGAGHFKCVKLLVDSGADVDSVIDGFKTPLYCAFTSLHVDSDDIFDLLMTSRSSVSSILHQTDFLQFLVNYRNRGHMNTNKLIVIAKHIIKLKSADYIVMPSLLPALLKQVGDKFNVSEFEEECARELKLLKETMIGYKLSLFDLMTKQTYRAAWCFNPRMVKFFRSKKHKSQFPLYCDSLFIAYTIAFKRRKLLNESEVNCSEVFSFFRVPVPAIQIVLDYLVPTAS